MGEKPILTEPMKAQVGKLVNTHIMQIDRRMIDQYLDAMGDPDPVWRDKAAAIQAGYAELPVPPGLITSMQMEGDSPSLHMHEQSHLNGAVDGGGEWEFYHPVYLGDVIAVTRKLVNIKERQGKLGATIINTFEVTYRNQRSVVVAKGVWTTFRYSTEE
jgi:acyl dehydratase